MGDVSETSPSALEAEDLSTNGASIKLWLPEKLVAAKNLLFAGSDAGGERAAATYSLIGTAELNGLDPEAYLRHVIACIAEYPVSRVDELLPWTVALKAATPEQKAA